MTHSLTGASSTERWMNCSGYLHLARQMLDGPAQDSAWRREGTAAHEIAAICLRDNRDAWEFIGESHEGTTVGEGKDEISSTDIQVFVDECRKYLVTDHWIETPIGADEGKRPHPGFYGTLDFAALVPGMEGDDGTLVVRDFKFGEGMYVEVERNKQLMYYAYGLILWLDAQGITIPLSWRVDLGIVQPRLHDGTPPLRTWITTAHEILTWGANELIPVMEARSKVTEADAEFVPGEWCRFCPCKLRCPALKGMFKAAATADPRDTARLTDDQLGLEYMRIGQVLMYKKAVEDEAFARLTNGRTVVGTKLVPKKSDRVWKGGAMPALVDRFGDLAMTSPELKSPAQMEKISDAAKQLVAEWAIKPNTGLTVALANDRRPSARVPTVAETFAGFLNRDKTGET